MLAGCGGSQPPIVAPGAMPQRAAIIDQAHQRALFASQILAFTSGIYVS